MVSTTVRKARSRRRLPLALLVATLLAFALDSRAARPARADVATEYQVKAAFLYNFAKYVEWPRAAFKDDKAPIVVGVLGDDPFGSALDEALEGKTVDGRRVVARRFAKEKDARQAHILFLPASEDERLPAVLRALAGASVMTVGDAERFAERGAVASFFVEESRVRFCVNVSAAARSDLKISSQLLKLAKIVNEEK
jgi:hypothetical protein